MDKVIHDMSWGSVSDYHEAQKQRDLAEEAEKESRYEQRTFSILR